MKRRRKRVSSSPLIDPAVSAIVLIAPDQPGFASMSLATQLSMRRSLATLTAAANIMEVPVFVSCHGSLPQALAEHLPSVTPERHFPVDAQGLPWLNPDFVAAVDSEDRTALLLAGFWLEHQVVATALHAMADAYDVYVLLDATAARAQQSEHPSHHRLMLAGAMPVITSQVVHEWLLEAPEASSRRALESLLTALLTADGQPTVI